MRVRVTGSHTFAIDNTISCITHHMYCSTFMCLHARARARVHIVFLYWEARVNRFECRESICICAMCDVRTRYIVS